MAKVKNDVWVRLDYDTWRKLPSTIKTMKSIMNDIREYENELKFGSQTKLFETGNCLLKMLFSTLEYLILPEKLDG